jgi:hypothetical protein
VKLLGTHLKCKVTLRFLSQVTKKVVARLMEIKDLGKHHNLGRKEVSFISDMLNLTEFQNT